MIKETLQLHHLNITVLGDLSSKTVFFIHEEKMIDGLNELLDEHPSLIVFISGNDWEKDFSPWAHSKVFRLGNDFTGGADGYLNLLNNELIPLLDSKYNLQNKQKVLCGYSLAGLFAIYASTKCDTFTSIIAASGSLWYPDFISYLKEHESHAKDIYLSIGDKESETKNQYLSKGMEAQFEAFTLFRAQNKNTILDINHGGHFQNSDLRLLKGMHWLLEGE